MTPRTDRLPAGVSVSRAEYDVEGELDLSRLKSLIARPGPPGDVVPVREAAGEEVHQVAVVLAAGQIPLPSRSPG